MSSWETVLAGLDDDDPSVGWDGVLRAIEAGGGAADAEPLADPGPAHAGWHGALAALAEGSDGEEATLDEAGDPPPMAVAAIGGPEGGAGIGGPTDVHGHGLGHLLRPDAQRGAIVASAKAIKRELVAICSSAASHIVSIGASGAAAVPTGVLEDAEVTPGDAEMPDLAGGHPAPLEPDALARRDDVQPLEPLARATADLGTATEIAAAAVDHAMPQTVEEEDTRAQDMVNDWFQDAVTRVTSHAAAGDRYGLDPELAVTFKKAAAAALWSLCKRDVARMLETVCDHVARQGGEFLVWTEKLSADESTMPLRVFDTEVCATSGLGAPVSSAVAKPTSVIALRTSQAADTKLLQTGRWYGCLFLVNGVHIHLQLEVIVPHAGNVVHKSRRVL